MEKFLSIPMDTDICVCQQPSECIFHDLVKLRKEAICVHCDKHIRFFPKTEMECTCEQPIKQIDRISRGRGHGRDLHRRHHTSCLRCNKKIKTIDDYQDDAANEINSAWACEQCHKKIYWFKFRMIYEHRTFIDQNIVKLDDDYNLLCDGCLKNVKYTIIPRYINCDLCHSSHERIFFSDQKGYGLCGHVIMGRQSPPTCAESRGSKVPPDRYIIDCGMGSCYEECSELQQSIYFINHELPHEIHATMNLCDHCIDTYIKQGVCFNPLEQTPLRLDVDKVVLQTDCLQWRPTLPLSKEDDQDIRKKVD